MVWWVIMGRKAGRERKSKILSLKCLILKANGMFYITIRIRHIGMAVQFCQLDVSQQTTRYGPRFSSAWGCSLTVCCFGGQTGVNFGILHGR